MVVVLVDGSGSVLFVCVGVGIVLLVGPAELGPVMFGATPGLAPVRLTGLPGFTPSDCVGCVGFWFAVPVLHIGVPGGRENSVVGLYAGGGGGLNMFTLLVSTKASRYKMVALVSS